jgi:hypothetical protein
MNRRDVIKMAGAGLALSAFPSGWVRAAGAPTRKVLFFTRSQTFEHPTIKREGDRHSHSEKVLIELGREHGFEVTATKDGRVFDSDLSGYDAFFFFTTGDLTAEREGEQPPMSADGKQKVLDAVARGKGFLAAHCGADTFHSKGDGWERQKDVDPYIAMLGGEFISHGPQQKARQRVASPHFPGVEGLESPYELYDEWYSLKNFADDMHVILVMETEGMEGAEYHRPPFPCTWARRHGEGRVFYTSMGHREDVWTNLVYQKVVLGGLSWATKNVEFDTTPNLSTAAPHAHEMPKRG